MLTFPWAAPHPVTWLLFNIRVLHWVSSKISFTSALYLLQHFWGCWVFWTSCLSTTPATASSPEGRRSSWCLDSRLVVVFYSVLLAHFHLSFIRPSLFEEATIECDLDIVDECHGCWTERPPKTTTMTEHSFSCFCCSMPSC